MKLGANSQHTVSTHLPAAQHKASTHLPAAQHKASTHLPAAQHTASTHLPAAQHTASTHLPAAQHTVSTYLQHRNRTHISLERLTGPLDTQPVITQYIYMYISCSELDQSGREMYKMWAKLH